MAKYDPLRKHRQNANASRITMSFAQIDQLVATGGGLPRSAYEYQAWWANERQPRTHVQKQAWMAAGYRIEAVDFEAGVVIFSKSR